MQVRTSHRDGGGAYLLLDGSRAMTGDLDLAANRLLFDGASAPILKKGTLQELWLRDAADTAFGNMRVRQLIISGNGLHFYYAADAISCLQTLPIQGYTGVARVTVANIVRDASPYLDIVEAAMSNLPGADPADGKNRIFKATVGGVANVLVQGT